MNAWPSTEKSPVSESEVPITIGDLVAALGLVLLVLLPLLLQAATTIAATVATVVRAKNRVP
jgi:hypothetical protein